MNIIAIIIARGGSKGIPNKNIIDFFGKPLIAWTIDACIKGGIQSVWVSSDSSEILGISKKYGAKTIKRPKKFSGDESSSESAWIHAIEYLNKNFNKTADWIFAPQVTSPLTEPKDIKSALNKVKTSDYDSYFSGCAVDDLLIWEKNKNKKLKSINYNCNDRKRRQESKKQFVENGAFYIFKPKLLIKNKNRFGKNIGVIEMDNWKIFEIDELSDIKICKILFEKIVISESKNIK
jgi:CMP-N,N'-diacetyllegionaminic acid synthase